MTSSYFKSIETFTFIDEKPLFNFEATENKTLVELISEIDALYGVVQYPSFDYFGENLLCSHEKIQNENEAKNMKKDLIAMNTTPSQHSMQINGNGTLKEVNSDVKFTKVWQEAFTNLNKDNHKIQIEDFQSLQHNESDKSLNLEENKSESESKCKDIQADQIEVQGQRERPHREFGVILKRWGRNDDRKVFSYLRSILPLLNMDLESFIYKAQISSDEEYNKIINCSFRLVILQDITQRFSWINTHLTLFKRLRKLTELQEFSFRESKLLKQTLKAMKNKGKSYDFQEIVNLFPGKYDESVVNESMRVLNISYNPF